MLDVQHKKRIVWRWR